MKSLPFNPSRDIPPLTSKVILITGGNIGLGKQSILEYANQGNQPAEIWLAARNLDKAKIAAEEIKAQLPPSTPAPNIKLLELDLASLESVKKAATAFTNEAERLDILMLNAGIMAAPPGLTEDGYEVQFGTNYLGHALLAKLLLPILSKTAEIPDSDVRIIAVSSLGHSYAPNPQGIIFSALKTPAGKLGPYERYGQSKLAQILWIRQMAKLFPQFIVAAVHPGIVRTNLMNNATGSNCAIRVLGKIANYVVTPVDQGVRNQLWASVSNDVKSGEYYEPVGVGGRVSELGRDEGLGRRLSEWTEEELEGWVV